MQFILQIHNSDLKFIISSSKLILKLINKLTCHLYFGSCSKIRYVTYTCKNYIIIFKYIFIAKATFPYMQCLTIFNNFIFIIYQLSAVSREISNDRKKNYLNI